MIWHDTLIREWAEAGGVTPYDANCVNPASLDLRLGNKFIDLATMLPFTAEKITLVHGDAILATTLEYIKMPANIAGSIYLKSTLARRGLDHSLAGWVDCEFSGTLTLELHAHRPIELYAGQRVLQMVFHVTVGIPSVGYRGRYMGQTGPTPARLDTVP